MEEQQHSNGNGGNGNMARLNPLQMQRHDESEQVTIEIKKNAAGNGAHGALAVPMSPVAAMFARPSLSSYVLCGMGLAHRPCLDSLKAGVAQCLLRHDRFCSVFKKGRNGSTKWTKKEQSSVEDHIVVPDLQNCIDAEDDDFVTKYMTFLANSGEIDASMPQWEIHVLNHKCRDAEATVVFKIHHSIGDCNSLMALLLDSCKILDAAQSKARIPPCRLRNRTAYPFNTGILQCLIRLFFCIWWTFVGVMEFAAAILWPDTKLPKSKDNGHYEMGHFTIDMADMRLIKQVIAGTINDVFMGVLMAGMVEYLHQLESEQRLPKRINKTSDVQIRTLVAVNLRSPPGPCELKEMMENKSQRWGNLLGLWTLMLPLHRRSNWLDYCRVSKTLLCRKKASLQAEFTHKCLALAGSLLGHKVTEYLIGRFARNATFVVSNVQGPSEELQWTWSSSSSSNSNDNNNNNNNGNVNVNVNLLRRMVSTATGNPGEATVHLHTYAGHAEMVVLRGPESSVDVQTLIKHCHSALHRMRREASVAFASA